MDIVKGEITIKVATNSMTASKECWVNVLIKIQSLTTIIQTIVGVTLIIDIIAEINTMIASTRGINTDFNTKPSC